MFKSSLIPLLFALSAFKAFAHPGESHEHHQAELRELRARHDFFKRSGESYSACSNSIQKRDLNNALAERRAREIETLREKVRERKRGLSRRQAPSMSGEMGGTMTMTMGSAPSGTGTGPTNSTQGEEASGGGGGSASFDTYGETLLNTSHASSRTDITANITSSDLFDDSPTCLLQPEVTIGPYWVSGEYIRSDVSESQPGIPIHLSTQVIDVTTCQAVPDIYWEIWHANASGVYSGVIASGNGDESDTTNINNTFCRGLQMTDGMGVATFQSVFPGHYSGRTTHLHVLAHVNTTTYPNGTIGADSTGALHIGQLFFDQTLLEAVNTVSPYSENTQTITENDEDSILAESTVSGSSDPFFDYVYLGDDISDGIYAWATVGITTNVTRETQAASYLDESGGHTASNSLDSMSGGGSMGNETTTSIVPSGSDILVAASSSASSSSSTSSSSSAVSASSSANSASRKSTLFSRNKIAGHVGQAITALLH